MPKKIPIVFNNGSDYHYHFVMKELIEEFKKQFTCLGENTKKYITFTVPIEQKLTSIDKNGEEIAKIYLPYYNLLIAQDLWQAQYQILPIVFLKEFIKLNVNLNMMMKNAKLVELNISIATVFLNKQVLRMI